MTTSYWKITGVVLLIVILIGGLLIRFRYAAGDALRMGRDAPWTTSVGKWVAQQLSAANITASNINGVGHSHGTYVLWNAGVELQKIQKQNMNVLVVLDPAGNVPEVSNFEHTHIKFSEISNYSIAIEGSYGAGSDYLAGTADVSFKVNSPYTISPVTEHGLPPHIFTTILNHENSAPGSFSKHFSIQQLMNNAKQTSDIYYDNDYFEYFEGVIDVRTPTQGEGIHFFDLHYKNPDGSEKTESLNTTI